MSEKMLNTRIQQKHDIEVNWLKAVNFIPKIGEIIVYDPDENHTAVRIKIGDGEKTVGQLPFISEMADWEVNDETSAAYIKNRTHWETHEYGIVLPENSPIYDADNGMFIITEPIVTYPTVGSEQVITWNGEQYTSICQKFDDGFFLGNPGIIGIGDDTGETFCMMLASSEEVAVEMGYYGLIKDITGLTTATLSIEGNTIIIHKLDKKFLPDEINSNIVNGSATGSLRTIYSSLEGLDDYTIGECAFAEGSETRACDFASHAEGSNTQASGLTSHAEGYYTKASGDYSHVQGKYNIEDTQEKYAHIVGNGSSDERSNAHTLDWEGNAWYQGDVYVGGTSQDDGKRLVTIDEVEAAASFFYSPNNPQPVPKSVTSINGKQGDIELTWKDVGGDERPYVVIIEKDGYKRRFYKISNLINFDTSLLGETVSYDSTEIIKSSGEVRVNTFNQNLNIINHDQLTIINGAIICVFENGVSVDLGSNLIVTFPEAGIYTYMSENDNMIDYMSRFQCGEYIITWDGSLDATTKIPDKYLPESVVTNDQLHSVLSAGSGITLTPDAANDKVIFAHADTSSVANVTANGRKYVTGLTFDEFGHVTGITTGIETVTNTDTTYDLAASKSSANGNVKLNLTAGGSGSGTDSVTIKGGGATTVTTDANGVITISSTDTDTNTDTKVTSAANHYTPAADSSALLSVDASSSTAATWNSTSLVTGVNLQRDAKGHVTGVTVDSIKMPANPNSDTNTTYDLAAAKNKTNGNVTLDLTAGGSGSGTDSVTIKGTGATTVTTDANGVITINSTDTNTQTVTSVNSKTGDVSLRYSDVSAAPTSHASTGTTYGVASASNYGHAMASSTSPKANGTAAVGSETAKFARGDHVHPLQTTVSGNAGTATKLKTPVDITLTGDVSGTVSFDGSADVSITTTVADSSHNHSASNITSGTLDAARIPNISIDKLVAGTTNTTIPSSLLPAYVDDVLEYTAETNFPTTGETGKIYVDKTTNLTYRWSGSTYVEISPSLALGSTSSTAHRGDHGAAAYAHAVTNKGIAKSHDLYKITTNSEGHVTAATAVTKADITNLGIPGSDTTYSAATSSTLGLVKSGGDVTISSAGVITVNDDSHNHTIANIDNLQTSLDGKADKNQGVFYIEGGGTTDTTNKVATWTGSHDDITAYYDGLTILYKVATAGSTTTTLNINNLGAVAVVRNATTAISTACPVDGVLLLTYTTDSSGTAYWKTADYDTNTKTTTGTSNKVSTKLYLVGATTQTSSGTTTYSNKNVYIGTDNCLYSNGGKVLTTDTNTTYTLSGGASGNTWVTTLTPSSGTATTSTVPAATTSAAGLMTPDMVTKLNGIATGATANTGDITGVTAGNGLTGGGTSGSVTLAVGAGAGLTVSADAIGHTNSVTAGTASEGGSARTLAFGGTFNVPSVTYDAQGHVTTKSSTKLTMPSDRLFTTLVPTGTSIPANADLNTTNYLKVGRYYCSKNDDAKTLKNCPTSAAFMMEVYSPLSTEIDNETTKTWVYRLRKITVHNSGIQFVQYCTAGETAGVWTYGAWRTVPLGEFTIDSTDTNGGSAAIGSATNPVYINSTGYITACTKEIPMVYTAKECTTYTSDSGTCTPLAIQNSAKQFAIPRPNYNTTTRKGSATDKAITRYSGSEGDVQDSKIIIEDVTNTKDTSKKAQVIAIPAEGNKKMVYGYCTDQVDGTSFIGGIFDKDATSYPYSAGLAIGGTSGNLLWKGSKVITAADLAAGSTPGVVKTTSTVTSTSGLTACPIISGVPYYKDTKYTHPTTSGNKHIPSGGSSGQILKWSADGTAVWSNNSVAKQEYTVSLSSNDWSETDDGTFIQMVTVNGISGNDTVIVDLDTTYIPSLAEVQAFGEIVKINTTTNMITVYSFTKPTVNITIKMLAFK